MKPVITRNRGQNAVLYVRDKVITVSLTYQLAQELHFEASIKPKYFQLWVNRKTQEIGVELVIEPTPYSRNITFNAYGGVMFSVLKLIKDMDVTYPVGSYPLKWHFNRNGFPHLVMGLPMRSESKLPIEVKELERRSKCCKAGMITRGEPEWPVKPGEVIVCTAWYECETCHNPCDESFIKLFNNHGEVV